MDDGLRVANNSTKLHNISKYNYIMKEFMKQTDVASEFLSFLREVNLYDVYLDEFKKEFHESPMQYRKSHQ